MSKKELLAHLYVLFEAKVLARDEPREKLDAAYQFLTMAIQEGRIPDQERLDIAWKELLYGKRPWITKKESSMAANDDWKDGSISRDAFKEYSEYMAELSAEMIKAIEAKGFSREEAMRLTIAIVPGGFQQ